MGDELAQRLADLEAEVSAHSVVLARLATVNADVDRRLERLEDKVGALQATVTEIEAMLAELTFAAHKVAKAAGLPRLPVEDS